MDFTPLDVKSSYSLLKSPTRISDLVTTAKERGYKALALTDENVLYGAVEFYNAAKKAGIKPIFGLRLVVALNETDGTKLDLVFLAKNQRGYQHLMDLSTLQQTRKDKKAPLTVAQISPLLNELFIIIPPQSTVFSVLAQPTSILTELANLGDDDSVLLGVNSRLDDVQIDTLQQLSKQLSLPLVGTSPVDYLNANDLFASRVLQAIDAGVELKDPTIEAERRGQHYLHSKEQVIQDYKAKGLSAAAQKTVEVATLCNVELQFRAPVLPHFKNQAGISSQQYLRSLCIQGLKKRRVAPGKTIQQYQERLAMELKIIHEMGFDDYFLIVWDVINFAHQQKITTDPGRGSAAGSLVAYALAITEVDPLQYDLLFERFLNPERAQMPDIDLDIPDNRRDEVLQYVHQKYGHQRVAQIITFGTLAAKQVVRDVSRVFNLPRYDMQRLIDALPHGLHVTLKDALNESQQLKNLLDDNPKFRLLIQVAQQLEGLPRHYSIHAAGIVLSEQPLHEVVPLQDGSDGLLMTQFAKDTVEALGLLKMDFLGLKNLSIMDNTLQMIRQEDPAFDLQKINFNDPLTLQLFQRGKTEGIFQFESSGIRNVLVNLHPTNFEDIVAVNALYRPGPMENIPHFTARKAGKEKIAYPAPSLEKILGPTYGILVYQEQVMQLASVMAGFTLGEADLLRRAMSKKKKATMEDMRTKFIAGATEHGYSAQVAHQVFEYIDRFANYGFNHSHAVAYSMMAFEMAYLKVHYPAAFFTALMNAETNIEKLKRHVGDAKQFGVKISGPRINISESSFLLHDGTVYFGFSAIKGVRRDFVAAILEERQENGKFTDLRNFITRIPERWQKQELIEPLIYSGAFDNMGYNRAEMIDALPKLISGIELFAGFANFDDPTLQTAIDQRNEFPLLTRLTKENEYLGVYLSGHPVTQYYQLGQQLHATKIADLYPNSEATIIVLTNHVKTIYTKREHREMAFVNGTDETGAVDITVFPKQYQQFKEQLETNKILIVRGRVEYREGRGLQLVANQLQDVKKVQQERPSQRWVLRILPSLDTEMVHRELNNIFNEYHGSIPVLLFYPANDKKILLDQKRWLKNSQKAKKALVAVLGQENVVLQQLNSNH
ncbi:DNA polymerase III subunit alpha [Limosilactobacillus reuteri]|mgnify:FL=1|uniref:DNA polymerase III subunit alpha n=2 Tax=Limosilactobacillus reuteri TaxID=1598 RepID=A0A143PZW0_LIMRT|nr:DNA polymerase III subunit alpha [Limosilactobacillus reuteri]CCC02963.1 DNA-directed DNA polymerase III alpha subunit [Limosilactobacillus reuteri subsp. suis]AMY13309.1 DNA polymerase III subunit alpha [Limosilactobacillus reuteri]MCC4345667.1 DNA polymerase III subunit alpha [Limosilactobacillus reuteri]MCC4350075.1 DNA polymerase III subunit alpha [Limosilactobacillus reuteri]MCC4359761.1 DNA polymerase III subunit alpha [Limosilactobacillus reuteri]